MKIAAAVFADFHQSFLGGPSQLSTILCGRTVLEHLLIRLARVTGLDHRAICVQGRDQDAAREAVAHLGMQSMIDVLPIDDGVRPRRSLIRSARKWNLSGWRGSPFATTWFDEYVEPLAVARVLDHYKCHHLLCLEGHQAALDVGIADRMIAYRREDPPEAQFIFTQAPPGLAGVILSREITRELLEKDLPLGITLAFRPEMPQPDLITKPHCFRVAPELIHTSLRLNADTRRGRELLEAGWKALGTDCDGKSLCTWLHRNAESAAGALPLEIELELTTSDPLPETRIRPRGARIPTRALENLESVRRLATELAAYDDRALVLAGHGDPLRHPRFAEICHAVRSAGVSTLGVTTPLVELSDENLAAIFESGVDALEVQVDAASAATYQQIHLSDQFLAVLANIERIQQQRHARQSPQPLIVCSLTRCAANIHELEEFYDHWIRQTGWALIHGYNDFGGRLGADPLMRLSPPNREACRRLTRRMMLLADGTTPQCSQDLTGKTSFGNWTQMPLVQLWTGQTLADLRSDHASGAWNRHAACRGCGEWFRP